MKILTHSDIMNLNIDDVLAYKWIRESFLKKPETYLPPKISMKDDSTFINVMPCILHNERWAGVKIVTRFPERIPTLNSEIILYDYATGNSLALLDGNYITALRTGAAAALNIETLAVKDYSEIGIIGFGNITRKTLDVLFSVMPRRKLTIKLYNYKDHFNLLCSRYSKYDNIEFVSVDTYEEVVANSDVIISALTYVEDNFCNDEYFKAGCLVVPIHTRGFMNCDLFFDRFVVDDISHVRGFKYFSEFESKAVELSDVLCGKSIGRCSRLEKVMAYSIGISIHDIFFAGKIYEMAETCQTISLSPPKEKYWV